MEGTKFYINELIKYDRLLSSFCDELFKSKQTPCVNFSKSTELKITFENYKKDKYVVYISDGIRCKKFIVSKYLDRLSKEEIEDIVDFILVNFLKNTLQHKKKISLSNIEDIIQSRLPINDKIYIKVSNLNQVDEIRHCFPYLEDIELRTFKPTYLAIGRNYVDWYYGLLPNSNVINIKYNRFENIDAIEKLVKFLINSENIYIDEDFRQYFCGLKSKINKYKILNII